MVDFDEAMSVLENRTRRAILIHLVREPHYSLQLSDLLDVSQQAIVKHLKVLEESGFVQSTKVASERGGPPKKLFKVDQSFSLRLDLGPDLFRTDHRIMPPGGPIRLSNGLSNEAREAAERIGSRRRLPMSEAMEILSGLDGELERIDKERDTMVALHQQVMSRVSHSIDDDLESYEERRLAREMLEDPRRPIDLDQFSRGLQLHSGQAEQMLGLLRARLLREIGGREGVLISAEETTPLPWWLAT
jgi:ArsR family transcriptional regulator